MAAEYMRVAVSGRSSGAAPTRRVAAAVRASEALVSIASPDDRAALADLPLHSTGKVREMYEVDGDLLMVASDRISAYDVIMPNPIPDKGRVLTQMSLFWFESTSRRLPQPLPLRARCPRRSPGRAIRVKRLDMYPIECVVRGYLSGSGWREYRESGSVCGIELPAGLVESDRLPEPIFTPATKAEVGDHDENIDFDRAAEIIGDRPLVEELRRISIELYEHAAAHAEAQGIILADTKFEFGVLARSRGGARRRGLHPRLVTLLAGRRLRAGPGAAVVRQAVPARLARPDRLGPPPARRPSSPTRWSRTPAPATSTPTSESPANPSIELATNSRPRQPAARRRRPNPPRNVSRRRAGRLLSAVGEASAELFHLVAELGEQLSGHALERRAVLGGHLGSPAAHPARAGRALDELVLALALLGGDRAARRAGGSRGSPPSFAARRRGGTRACSGSTAGRRTRRSAAGAARGRRPGPRSGAPCRCPAASRRARWRALLSSSTHFVAAAWTSPGPQLTSLSDIATSRPSRIRWMKWASGRARWIRFAFQVYGRGLVAPARLALVRRVGLVERARGVARGQRIVVRHPALGPARDRGRCLPSGDGS